MKRETFAAGDLVAWITHVGGYYWSVTFLGKVVGLTPKRVRIALPRRCAPPDERTVSPTSLRRQTPEESARFLPAWERSSSLPPPC